MWSILVVQPEQVMYRLMEGAGKGGPRWHRRNWQRTTAFSGSSQQSIHKKRTPGDHAWDLLCVRLASNREWAHWCGSFLWNIGKQCRPTDVHPQIRSDQGFNYLLTECSIKNWLNMKNTTQQPLKWKWTGPIDKEWEISFDLDKLIKTLMTMIPLTFPWPAYLCDVACTRPPR